MCVAAGVRRGEGLDAESFRQKTFSRVGEHRPFHFASVMHFIVGRLALVRMVETVVRGTRARHPKAQFRLTAVAPWVYAEGVGETVGIEKLAFSDGTCLPCRKFLRVLKTCYPKANVTLEGNETGLRVERFQMLPEGFRFKAVAPSTFQIVTAEAWLAPKGSVGSACDCGGGVGRNLDVPAELVRHGAEVPLTLKSEHGFGRGEVADDERRGARAGGRVAPASILLAAVVAGDDVAVCIVNGEGDTVAVIQPDDLTRLKPCGELG